MTKFMTKNVTRNITNAHFKPQSGIVKICHEKTPYRLET